MNEHDRAAGRGGTGAVAGYKKLKAIVIKAAQKGNMPQPKLRRLNIKRQTKRR